MVDILLKAGVPVNNFKSFALVLAVKKNNEEIVRKLIKFGADRKNNEVISAARERGNKNILKILNGK